jgi:hypothetical protein
MSFYLSHLWTLLTLYSGVLVVAEVGFDSVAVPADEVALLDVGAPAVGGTAPSGW